MTISFGKKIFLYITDIQRFGRFGELKIGELISFRMLYSILTKKLYRFRLYRK